MRRREATPASFPYVCKVQRMFSRGSESSFPECLSPVGLLTPLETRHFRNMELPPTQREDHEANVCRMSCPEFRRVKTHY